MSYQRSGGMMDPIGLDAPWAEAEDVERFEQIPEPEMFGEAPWAEEYLDIIQPMPRRIYSPSAAPGVSFPSGLSLAFASGATGKGEEHWDPNDSGLPLLATGPDRQGDKLSRNFTVRELVVSGGRAAPVARISPQLVTVLQGIRDRVGKSVSVFSGYRSWKRNKEVYDGSGKKPTLSRHCSGQGADIKVAGVSGIELAKIAIDVGGTELGIGVWSDKLHVDVRPTWAVWTYMKGAADADAKAAVNRYRQQRLKGGASPAPPPAPSPRPTPTPAPASGDRLVVDRHPLLQGHRGTGPDLILSWNATAASGVVDVVIHFHGYAPQGLGRLMRLSDKEPKSGLDFGDPAGSGAPGRSRPTIAVLPRGHFIGDQPGVRHKGTYVFPKLTGPGALRALIDDALARVGAATGQSLTLGRLILTGHSGGGAPIDRLLAHAAENDPDEVHIFDAMYQAGGNLLAWARRRVQRELTSPAAIAPALRILYNPRSSTEKHSKAFAKALCAATGVPGGERLRPRFRVDRTDVAHDAIPRRFGWRLLADAGADLPAAKTLPCAAASAREFADEMEAEELAWTDFEASEQADEAFGPQQLDTGWDEDEASEGDGEGEHDLAELEAEAGAETDETDEAGEAFDAPRGEPEEEDFAAYDADGEQFEPPDAEEPEAAEASASEATMLDRLLESEAGVGTGLADRLKGAATLALGPTLRRGDSGAGVASLQRALNALGADLAVDGAFGPNTEGAVRAFQARSGLKADGLVGPATKAAIAQALGGGISPTPAPPVPVPPANGKKLTPAQFVAAFLPSARQSHATFGVPVLVTLGQAALESGWGEKAPRFNFFGLKANASDPEDSRQLLQTREVLRSPNATFPKVISKTLRPDGRYVYIVLDWFRAFPNATAAFDARGEVLRRPRYAKAFAVAHDPYRFAAEIHRAGYATEPTYTTVLHKVMRMIERAGGAAATDINEPERFVSA